LTSRGSKTILQLRQSNPVHPQTIADGLEVTHPDGPGLGLRAPEASGHIIHCYGNEAALAEQVAAFISAGIKSGEAALIVATAGHWESLTAKLRESGFDLPALQGERKLIYLDARETLGKILAEGKVDACHFQKVVGHPIQAMLASHSGLRVFGEMAALLWSDGNHEAASSLEELWGNLSRAHPFSLFSAYPMQAFASRQAELEARKATESALLKEARPDALDLARLEEARKRLAAIVESSNDAIISKDLKGIINSWNKGAERIFGYTASEIIGKPVTLLIPKTKQDEEPSILARIRKGERIEHYETLRRRKDGSLIEISLSVSPIRNERGEIIGASKIARDITEQKRYQAALTESEMRFRDMADSAPVFVWMSGPDGLVTYFNKPWLEFTGRSMALEMGSGWVDGIHSEDAKRFQDGYFLALQAHTGFRMEYRMRRCDGDYRWMLNTGMPRISPNGEFLGFIGSCLDITELKNTAEQLRQAQKMEVVGRLAGGIAHDFNNLLTAINGYSEMALGMVDEDEPLHEFLGEIKKSGERAAALTQQLLAYSRKQILAPKVFDLNEAVSEMGKMLQRLIGEDIVLETLLDPDLGLAKADPGQVQQIILNLVLNARDAMPDGGSLLLETGSVLLSRDQPEYLMDAIAGPYVRLTVTDNGIGMTPEVKAKIFEPFFTTKAVGHGTGLGLSSVYGILKQSGGSIAVTSEPGRGSAFHVFLPLADPQSRPRAPRQIESPHATSKGETILLVEDEDTVRKFIQRILAANGYDVLEAKEGEAALRLVKEHPSIDLVLTDVVMPKMNGGALAEKLKLLQPDINILFMSGYASNIFLSKGLLDPGARFLQKPFNQAELLQKVKQILLRPHRKTAR